MFVGYLRKKAKPSFMAKLLAITCKNYGLELIYITPKGIQMKSKKVNGYVYINNKWEKVTAPLPRFIDISPILFSHKKYKEVLDYLKKNTKLSIDERHIILKSDLQKELQKNKKLSHLAIPTRNVTSFNDLLDWLKKYNTIVAKPVRGMQGNGVYIINYKEPDIYNIGIQKEEDSLSKKEFEEFFAKKLQNKGYIVQKYISSRSIYGDPYDCRIHFEKNGQGEWAVAKSFIRIGIGQKVVSNISQGGAVGNTKSFLKANFGEEKGKNIYLKLKKLASELPYEIEHITNKTLMNMGVDVGIDENGDLYIFEINSFPIVTPHRSEIALLRVAYYKYVLTRENSENDQSNYDKYIKELENELTKIKKSTSWKVTKPLRKLGKVLKGN